MSRSMAMVHTASISHETSSDGVRTAHGICTDCEWVGPDRLDAGDAWEDRADHEEGIEVRP